MEKLETLRKLLYDLHKKWSEDPFADGHHKSCEGAITLTLDYPNWFEAVDYLRDEPEITVEVYSYLFGPNRVHTFKSIDDAIEEVKTWKYDN